MQSIQRSHFPTHRAAAARAAASTPRLMSAARVGPVVYGLLLTFRGDGYFPRPYILLPPSPPVSQVRGPRRSGDTASWESLIRWVRATWDDADMTRPGSQASHAT